MSTRTRQITAAALAAAVAVGLIGAVPAQGAQDPELGFISGRVTLHGEPQRAEVRLVTTLDQDVVSLDPAEETDEDGYFTFSDAELSSEERAGEWILVAEGPETTHATFYGNTVRHPEAMPIRFVQGETVTADIELVPAAVVEGLVLDSKGHPVERARVNVYNDDYTYESRQGRTDRHGRFVISAPLPGKMKVFATYQSAGTWYEAETAVKAVRGSAVTAPDLVPKPLPKDGKFTAKVTRLKKSDSIWLFDTKTRHAVAPSTIATSYKMVRQGDTATIKATLLPGTYRLVISGTNVASKAFKVKPKKTTKVPSFKGPKKRNKLTGKIKRANGKPLKSAFVRVYDAYGTPKYGARLKKKGKYQVSGLGKGFYSILAESTYDGPDRTVKHVVVKKKKTKKSFTMVKMATMTGTVTDGSEPVQGIGVYLVRSTESGCIEWSDPGMVKKLKARNCVEVFLYGGRTNAQGRYSIPRVPVGQHTFIAYDPSGGGYSTHGGVVKVKKKGATVWDVDLVWK